MWPKFLHFPRKTRPLETNSLRPPAEGSRQARTMGDEGSVLLQPIWHRAPLPAVPRRPVWAAGRFGERCGYQRRRVAICSPHHRHRTDVGTAARLSRRMPQALWLFAVQVANERVAAQARAVGPSTPATSGRAARQGGAAGTCPGPSAMLNAWEGGGTAALPQGGRARVPPRADGHASAPVAHADGACTDAA